MSTSTLDDLSAWATALGGLAAPGEADDTTDEARVDQLRALEQLKASVNAAQLRVGHAFEESQRAAQRAAGTPEKQVGRGVALQVALALRQSHHRARRFLGTARILCTEMPHTLDALGAGRIDDWRATLLVRETACLSKEHRATIDETVAGSDDVERLSTKQLVASAHHLAAKLGSAGVAERQRLAEADRRVTLRPAPDTMSYLTGLFPVADAVAMYAALKASADKALSDGDERTRGQIMADTMIELVTGRSTQAPPPVEVHLVMTDRSLLAGSDEPAVLRGYDVVPAEWARDLVKRAAAAGRAWVRRLYVAPGGRALMAMDSRRRTVPAGIASYIADRDQLCRMPWCGAPVRHVDHVQPYRETGTTRVDDLQGLCVACNLAKEALGWSARPREGPTHTTEITTPTGHTYDSAAPLPPGGDDEVA